MKFILLLSLFFSLASQNNSTEFNFNFYNQLIYGNSQTNILFSSYSLRVALSILLEGCAGESAIQVQQACLLPSDAEERQLMMQSSIQAINEENQNYELKTVNALWPEISEYFEQSYKQVVKDYYFGIIQELDYTNPENSRLTINEWVSNQTNSKIQDLLPQGFITTDTRLVITNCLYFKGTWKYQFDPLKTFEETFQIQQEQSVQVKMMSLENVKLPYYEDSFVKVISLPYEGEVLSMLVVLPVLDDKNVNTKEFSKKLTADNFTSWLQIISEETVNLYLPQFSFEWSEILNPILQHLGIQEIFTTDANLSKINGDNLFVSDVIQKTFIEVNEKGAEAAAATAVVFEIKSISENAIKTFKANHPFHFIIYHKVNNEILFMGNVYNPSVIENNFLMKFEENISNNQNNTGDNYNIDTESEVANNESQMEQMEQIDSNRTTILKQDEITNNSKEALGAALNFFFALQFCLLMILLMAF